MCCCNDRDASKWYNKASMNLCNIHAYLEHPWCDANPDLLLPTWLILQHRQCRHGGIMGFECSVQYRLLITGRCLWDLDDTRGHHIAPYYCSAAVSAPRSWALAERSKSGPAIPSIYRLHQRARGWLGTAQFANTSGWCVCPSLRARLGGEMCGLVRWGGIGVGLPRW